MGEIGCFGDIVFEVSDTKKLSFKGFTRDTASKYENHELIGQKPRTEFVAPGLDTVSFTVSLSAWHGVKPLTEMNKWLEYCRGGDAFPMVIGGRAIGVDKWVVTSVSQQWDTIFNQGELVAGKVDVTLQEYLSAPWTVKAYREGWLAKQKAKEKEMDELAAVKEKGYNSSNAGSQNVEAFIDNLKELVSSGNGLGLVPIFDVTDVENLGNSINIPDIKHPVLLHYISQKLEESTGYRLTYSQQTNMLSVSNQEKNHEVPAKWVLAYDLEIVDAAKVIEVLEGIVSAASRHQTARSSLTLSNTGLEINNSITSELVTHQPGDLFKQPKHAAIAYYLSLSSGILENQDGKTTYILGNTAKNRFYFALDQPQINAFRATANLGIPVGVIISSDGINALYSCIKNKVQYFYETVDSKINEVKLIKIADLVEKTEKRFNSTIESIKSDFDYIKSYANNPQKIDDLMVGFSVAVIRNCIDSSIDITEIVTELGNIFACYPVSQATVDRYFNNRRYDLRRLLDLSEYAYYPDAYYLGKVIGDLFTMVKAIQATVISFEGFLVGLLGTAASITTALGTNGLSLVALAPNASLALASIATASVAVDVATNAAVNMSADIDKFGESKGRRNLLADKIRSVGNDILDKMEAAGGHTLEKHVSQTNEELIRRAIQDDNIGDAVTSFTDKGTATKAVQENLRKNADEIVDWLFNPDSKGFKTFNVSHNYSVGKGVPKDAKHVIYDLMDSCVYVVKDSTQEIGFKIITAYPVIK